MNNNTKPKKFRCTACKEEYYVDMAVCKNCSFSYTVLPIPRDVYHLYLNNQLYGSGTLEYMGELMTEYVVTRKMYGKENVELKVVKARGE